MGPWSWSRIKARDGAFISWGDTEGYATTRASFHLKLKRLIETSLIDGSQRLGCFLPLHGLTAESSCYNKLDGISSEDSDSLTALSSHTIATCRRRGSSFYYVSCPTDPPIVALKGIACWARDRVVRPVAAEERETGQPDWWRENGRLSSRKRSVAPFTNVSPSENFVSMMRAFDLRRYDMIAATGCTDTQPGGRTKVGVSKIMRRDEWKKRRGGQRQRQRRRRRKYLQDVMERLH